MAIVYVKKKKQIKLAIIVGKTAIFYVLVESANMVWVSTKQHAYRQYLNLIRSPSIGTKEKSKKPINLSQH